MKYVCLIHSSRSLVPQMVIVTGRSLIDIRAACRTELLTRPGSTQAHLYLGAELMETIHPFH